MLRIFPQPPPREEINSNPSSILKLTPVKTTPPNERQQRIQSILKYLLIRSLNRKDLEVSIEFIDGEEDDEPVRKILFLEVQRFIEERRNEVEKEQYNCIEINCRGKHVEKIDGLLLAELQLNKRNNKFHNPNGINLIVLHNLQEQLSSEERTSMQDGLRNFINSKARSGKVIRIIIISKNPLRMVDANVHNITFGGISIPGFLYRRFLRQRQEKLEQYKDLFQDTSLPNQLSNTVKHPNLKLVYQDISVDLVKLTERVKSTDTQPTLHRFASSLRSTIEESIANGWARLNEDPPVAVETASVEKAQKERKERKERTALQSFLSKLARFSNGVTLQELQMPIFQERGLRLAEEISRMALDSEYRPIYYLPTLVKKLLSTKECLEVLKENTKFLRIKVEPSFSVPLPPTQRPMTNNPVTEEDAPALEYLVHYTRYLLYDLDYPERKLFNIEEDSCMLKSGIFFFRRTENFRDLFDQKEELSEEQEFKKAEFKDLERSLNIAGFKPTFAKLYALHYENVKELLIRFSSQSFEDKRLFHYFSELAFNTVALQVLHEDIGWQMANEELISKIIKLMRDNKEKLERQHPISASILFLKISLVHIQLKRRWGRKMSRELKELKEFFERRRIENIIQNQELIKIWNIEYTINDLYETNLDTHNKEHYYQQLYRYFVTIDEEKEKLLKDPIKNKRIVLNYQRLTMRLAMLVADAVYKGMSIDRINQQPNKKKPSKRLAELLNDAVIWFSNKKAKTLYIRALLYLQHLRRVEIELEAEREKETNERRFTLSSERTKEQALAEVKKNLRKIYFDFHSEQLTDIKTKEMLIEMITKVNRDIKECAKYAFVFLVRQGYIAKQPILYHYEAVMRFIRDGIQSIKSTSTPTLMNRFTKSNFDLAVESGSQVLFLLIDGDLQNQRLEFDRDTHIHQPRNQRVPLDIKELCDNIALSSCEIVVICGRKAKDLTSKIMGVADNKVWPALIAVEISTALIPEADTHENLIDLMEKQFLYKFLVTFCDQVGSHPSESFAKIRDINSKILNIYRRQHTEELSKRVAIELIQESGTEELRTKLYSKLRFFDSEWHSKTNMKLFETGNLPTILTNQIADVYMGLTKIHERPSKTGEVIELVGPERKSTLTSVVRLLMYHTPHFMKGLYCWDVKRNKDLSFPQLMQQLVKPISKQENESGKILVAFHFQDDLPKESLQDIRRTADMLKEQFDCVILSVKTEPPEESQKHCEVYPEKRRLVLSCYNPRNTSEESIRIDDSTTIEVLFKEVMKTMKEKSIFPKDGEAKSELQRQQGVSTRRIAIKL